MDYNPDKPLSNITNPNSTMTIGKKKKKGNKNQPPAPAQPNQSGNGADKPRPFMTGNRKDKQGDMEGVADGIKGAQMLIKTLFPSDEPIPRR